VDGGFLTVIRKGDLTSGAILLIGQARGENPVLFERLPSLDDIGSWQAATAQMAQNDTEVSVYWKKRSSRDPDLWVVELDVASPERLSRLLGTHY
jgi:hypothetical protein